MAYEKQNFIDGLPLFAKQLNHIEDGIANAMTAESKSEILNEVRAGLNQTDVVGALPLTGGTMSGAINMNNQKLSGLPDPTVDSDAVPKKFMEEYVAENGGKVDLTGYATEDFVNEAVKNVSVDLTEYATETYVDDALKKVALPYNYADNSDFTQFIAQAGIGGNHGNQTYAGDRWILDSGTVTGEERADGNGYNNVTLKGTIRQIVANPPDVGSVFVEMVSGTATAEYDDGEVTITSNGGVIRNVLLCEGSYTVDNKPKYQPKGYGVEFAECKRYFMTIGLLSLEAPSTDRWIPFNCLYSMRTVPTITFEKFTNNSDTTVNAVVEHVACDKTGMWLVRISAASYQTMRYAYGVKISADL